MKVNRWLVLLLMLTGLGVGAVSLYMASLSGVMGKMGLVGGDFSQDINQNALARVMRDRKPSECGMWVAVKQVPSYLLSKNKARINLSGELGKQRVECGIDLVQKGNTERGVYSIIKGLYYLQGQYNEMRVLVRQDRTNCVLIADASYEEWVQGYLGATRGRVHDIVFDLYKQVEVERAGVEELCSD